MQLLTRLSIGYLLLLGSPSYVPGNVVAIRVDSIYGVRGTRARSDVVTEGREIMQPFGSDEHAATTPVLEITGLGIAASFLHVLPRSVLRGSASAVYPMREARFSQFGMVATTGRGMACSQSCAWYDCQLSTTTTTAPAHLSVAAAGHRSDYIEAAECLAG